MAPLFLRPKGHAEAAPAALHGKRGLFSFTKENSPFKSPKRKVSIGSLRLEQPLCLREYALRYLLTENGIDPDNDVTIDWKSEHSECVAALASAAEMSIPAYCIVPLSSAYMNSYGA